MPYVHVHPRIKNPSPEQIDPYFCPYVKTNSEEEDFQEQCRKRAGHGTKHVGTGLCRSHGGTAGRPITHGIYSQVKVTRLSDLIEASAELENPLDLFPHVHALNALIVDYINRHDEITEAVLAWHSSFDKAYQAHVKDWHKENAGKPVQDQEDMPSPVGYGKPTMILDISAAAALIDRTGDMIARIKKLQSEGAITLLTMNHILTQHGTEFVASVRKHIDDPDLQTALIGDVEERWGRIPIVAPRGNSD